MTWTYLGKYEMEKTGKLPRYRWKVSTQYIGKYKVMGSNPLKFQFIKN